MTSEIQMADPAARRRALVLVFAAMFFGAATAYIASDYMDDLNNWLLRDDGQQSFRLQVLIGAVAMAVCGGLVAGAVYFRDLGTKVISSRRFPPPGTVVIRNVRVRTGEDAHKTGQMLLTFGYLLLLAALILGFMFWRLAALLGAESS